MPLKSGFYISCIMNREESAYREFVAKAANMELNAGISCSFPVADFAKELRQELRALKTNKNFAKIDEYKSILIIENKTIFTASEIFERLREQECIFHSIQRILPLDIYIKYDESEIRRYVLEKDISGSFKILYEHRLCDDNKNNDIMKDKIFGIIIPLVPCKVDLKNPDFVIIVQVFKNYIGLAVVKNDHKNFNFSIKTIDIK